MGILSNCGLGGEYEILKWISENYQFTPDYNGYIDYNIDILNQIFKVECLGEKYIVFPRLKKPKFGIYLVLRPMASGITNGEFEWGGEYSGFICQHCMNITSLKGLPKITKFFSCNDCRNLTSLQGAPQNVKDFSCSCCSSLTSLEGAPQECKNFDCQSCDNLTSLKGAPKACGYFDCRNCHHLTTLKYAPKICKRLDCSMCYNLKNFGQQFIYVNFFDCRNCTNLTTLKGSPFICRDFYLGGCYKLKNLKGSPIMTRTIWLFENEITSLEGCPKFCKYFTCDRCNNLTSLKYSPWFCWAFSCSECSKIQSLEGMCKIIYEVLIDPSKNFCSFKGAPWFCINYKITNRKSKELKASNLQIDQGPLLVYDALIDDEDLDLDAILKKSYVMNICCARKDENIYTYQRNKIGYGMNKFVLGFVK